MWAGFEYVTIEVDGTILMGWQEVEIERSMQSAEIAFHLVATAPAWSSQAMSLRRGKSIIIRSALDDGLARRGGGDLICKGAIDDYEADIGEKGHKIVSLSGRSHSRDAIDCQPVDHKTGKVTNKTLLDAMKDLGREFDVPWTSDQKLDKLPLVQRRPEETLFQTGERYARRLGLMLAATPEGGIDLTRAGEKRHAGVLIEGQSPVRKVRVKIAPHTKRSPMVARGQTRLGHGKDSLRQEQRDEGEKGDRHRPGLVIAEGDHTLKDLKRRAEWERLRRAGYGMQVTPIVTRWRDESGSFWEPGRLMANKVPSEDVDQDLTLSTAKFRQSIGENAGTTAELSFVDPKAHGGKGSQGKSDPAFSPGSALED